MTHSVFGNATRSLSSSPSSLPFTFPGLSLNSRQELTPGHDRSPPLLLLPPELIEQIGVEVSMLIPYGPPTELLNLLLVCKRLYTILGPTNEGFYADLFKLRFDYHAAERRWQIMARLEAKRVKAAGGVQPPTCWRPFTNTEYSKEFKRRCKVLSSIRHAPETGAIPPNISRPSSPKLLSVSSRYRSVLDKPDEFTQHMWTVYLMLIENDGKNLPHLLEYAQLHDYTELFYEKALLSDALKPGWPKQSARRGLGLWISWLAGDDVSNESTEIVVQKSFVLKPYVFGAHKFDAYFAPWTLPDLPVTPEKYPITSPPSDPFHSDLRPIAHAQQIIHMGRKMNLSPPVLAHAAICSFFHRIEQDPESLVEMSGEAALPEPIIRQSINTTSTMHLVKPVKTPRPILASRVHDDDFIRLASCIDPYSSVGLPRLFYQHKIEGSWEGRFSFFDFDSYRDTLGGRIRSLYEGPYGDQPQVWKIEEKLVFRQDGVFGGTGHVLNAGFEIGQPGPAMTGTYIVNNPQENLLVNGNRRKSFEEDLRISKRARGDTTEGDWDEDYEILLTGQGHSAWGQFVLKGRVRPYDGMFSITKEYCSDVLNRESRGRWLYRGYIVNGNMIGRWRDTHTPENLNGYEGTFNMKRREE